MTLPIRAAAAALLVLLLAALAFPAAPAQAAACGPTLAKLQRDLLRAGYPAGRPDGCKGPATRAGIQAFQLAQGLAPDGVVGPATRRALRRPRAAVLLAAAPANRIEVQRARGLLLVVRAGRAAAVYAASTGKAGFETPAGTFRVAVQQPRSWSGEYDTWLPWASYFLPERGIAVHGGVVPTRPDSHGCVRVPLPFAADVYRAMPPGTAVVVV
jgi:peptidoglycan hydrolase-like protein with peptidoglycan-binding domain